MFSKLQNKTRQKSEQRVMTQLGLRALTSHESSTANCCASVGSEENRGKNSKNRGKQLKKVTKIAAKL